VSCGVVVSNFNTQRLANPGGKQLALITLTRSWILVELFMMPKLQNHITSEIHLSLLDINCAGYNLRNFAKTAIESIEVPLATSRKALRIYKDWTIFSDGAVIDFKCL
jgi:hypothetical protein